jgi:pimeloyl-ACP methyl ester carboxylesterase
MNDLKQNGGSATDVRVPTLIIHSKYDKSVGVEHAQKLHQEIVGSQLSICDAESHMIWFSDSYEEVQKIMKHFLTNLNGR